jgi:hypothetical protein
MIKRLLVANHGEIATSRTDCRTVYLYIAEFGVDVTIFRGARDHGWGRDCHPVTVSPWRWATLHSPDSRRYTWVARSV